MPSEVVIRQPHASELGTLRNFRRSELDIAVDPSQTGPLEPTKADLAPTTIHMAAFIGDEVVSSVRLEQQLDDPSTYLVNRMVTRSTYRSQGIGTQVIKAAEAVAIKHGARTFTLNSRPFAKAFYLGLGYKPSGERPHNNPDHISMIKEVENGQLTAGKSLGAKHDTRRNQRS